MLARIIEPVSKLGSLRVLAEAGITPPSYATVKRRLRVFAGLPAKGVSPAAAGDGEVALPHCGRSSTRPVAGGGLAWRGPAPRTSVWDRPRTACMT